MIHQSKPERLDRHMAVIRAVLESNELAYLNGSNGKAFEREFARLASAPHGISCNSGTSALYIALKALDLPVGGEVLTTPVTFVSTIHAIVLAGLVPKLVDVSPTEPCLYPEAVEESIGPKTCAILPVHLFGVPCDMKALCSIAAKYQIPVVEDCAQALASRIDGRWCGTWGEMGCFSFSFAKMLTLCGEGGMVVTRDSHAARRVAELRNVGYRHEWDGESWSVRGKGEGIGLNLRMLEIQSAIGLSDLAFLPEECQWRRTVAETLASAAQRVGLQLVRGPVDSQPVYHALPFEIVASSPFTDAGSAVNLLSSAGVPAERYYQTPVNRHVFYLDLAARALVPADQVERTFPHYEKQSRNTIIIKLSAITNVSKLEQIAETFSQFESKTKQ